MNLITSGDVKKFLTLVKTGLKEGRKKELTNYTSSTMLEGTDIPKEYFVSLSFHFFIDASVMDELFIEDDFSSQVNDLIKDL